MKFLLLLLISFSAMASYLPESKIGKDTTGMKIYSKQKKCQNKSGENCLSIRKTGNMSYHIVENEMMDNEDAPIWANRSGIEVCSGEEDCQLKLSEKSCSGQRNPYMNAEFTEVWCNKINGYEQIPTGKRIIAEDSAKKAIHDAAELAKETVKNDEKTEKQNFKTKKWSELNANQKDRLIKFMMQNI